MNPRRWALRLVAGAAIAATASCSGSAASGGPGAVIPGSPDGKGRTPISHVIVVIQENRSFDNFFATFPGADGTTTGQGAPMPPAIATACKNDGMPVITQSNPTVTLTKVSLIGAGFPKNFGEGDDLPHVYVNPNDSSQGFLGQYDGGKMDGFDLEKSGPDGEGGPLCTYAYQYVDPQEIQP
ncbi:MAG TPA: alkaline phosphatase family protein, partial [Candidatus Baltobacteraceae bacterium]|nr:alkaline phosphatase family protein [Candidatus Baltobacteraceae bacterium]